jgi:subtilase family serine protease
MVSWQTPLWAALVARINGIKGRPAGLLNPLLYANTSALLGVL